MTTDARTWECLDCGSTDLHEGPDDPPPWCCCKACGSANVGERTEGEGEGS